MLLYILLIPKFGPMGAAWASCGGLFSMFLLGWAFSHRQYPVRYEYRRLLMAAVLFAFLMVGSQYLFMPTVFVSVLVSFGLVALLPIGLALLGVVRRDELQTGWSFVYQVWADVLHRRRHLR